MKTNNEINKNKIKRYYIKCYAGQYPPGGYISWPETKSPNNTDKDIPHGRTKTGGFIALPISRQ